MPRQRSVDSGYSWVVLAAGFTLQFLAPAMVNAMGLYFLPFEREFPDRQHQDIMLLVSISLIVLTFSGLIASFTYGLIGSRNTLLLGSLIASASSVCAFFATKYWQLCLTQALIGLGVGLIVTPNMTTQTEYFDKYSRLALALLSMGGAIGVMFISPFVSYLIETFSWRGSMLIMGGVSLNSVACALIMRPQVKKKSEEATSSFNLKDLFDCSLIRHPLFFVMIGLAYFMFGSLVVYYSLLAALIDELGHPESLAATMLSVTGLCGLFGRIIAVLIARFLQIAGNIVQGCGLLVNSAAMFLLPLCTETWQCIACACLYGLSNGAAVAIGPPTMLEVFGHTHKFHRVMGMASFFIGFSVTSVPVLMGWVVNASSFSRAFTYTACALVFASVGNFILGFYCQFVRNPRIQRLKEQQRALEDEEELEENENAEKPESL